MKYAFIHAELGGYPLSIVCRVLGVTQAGYHASQAKVPSPRDHERDALRASIRSVFEAQRGRYGAPRILRFSTDGLRLSSRHSPIVSPTATKDA